MEFFWFVSLQRKGNFLFTISTVSLCKALCFVFDDKHECLLVVKEMGSLLQSGSRTHSGVSPY